GFWLLVVGRDREEARFAGQARAAGLAERVRFLGGRDDVRPLYAAADCFILPSRYDPFPNTALEAFAMGLPAIVSSRCGAAEIIEPGVNGWVCEPDDAASIARLMHEADRAMRSGSLPQAARATAERLFPALIKPLLDGGFGAQVPSTPPALFAAAIVAIFLVRGILTFISSYLMNWVSSRVVLDLRTAMFDRLLKLPASFYADHTS